MKLFPASAPVQLEFEKVKQLLQELCKSEFGKSKAADLRIHTRIDYIQTALQQTHEYQLILQAARYFPNDYVLNLQRELKLLSIEGAVLGAEECMEIRKLAEGIRDIFRWFDADTRLAFPALFAIINVTQYEKAIVDLIDKVLDENGQVKDSASKALGDIRMNLYKKRNELRRMFDKIVQKWTKAGYVADIEEAFLNGRRVVAVFAESKRQVKGILLGESDTRRTAFIEPEETIELNNEVFALENEESAEVYRILRQLTASLSAWSGVLKVYHDILGEFDFVRGRARLSVNIGGNYPQVIDKAHIELIQAYHPLLFLYNQKLQKPVIPVNLKLDANSRILVISGPNAGGKTVTLKTVGLLQMMLQAGLLVPVHPTSVFGIFKQLMIHIGDTQSLEFELSTYSSHLKNMKHFIENANGKTLFFIDELGSGSDPNLGGAFAEVILDELARKHAFGIVTTHYLNLKVMANKTPGIINGAMAFDEDKLLPLYKLMVGKPGSSYTFSIAERIGLEKSLIQKARQLVESDHFRLDKLLNRAEQDQRQVEQKDKSLEKLIKENEKLKAELETLITKEKHRQQIELLKHQNKVTDEKLAYLRDTERKLRQIAVEWKKSEQSEDKKELIKQIRYLLFNQNHQQTTQKVKKKIQSKYNEIGGTIKVGLKVLMKKNHQVGEVKEIRGKKAVVQLGLIPLTIDVDELVVVQEKRQAE